MVDAGAAPDADAPSAEPAGPPLPAAALFLNVFVVAMCGLVYELLAGTLGSYLLGDSTTQFSLVIGLYLSAMGVGAWLSRFLDRDLGARFIDIELAVALIGGLSAPALFFLFGSTSHFQVVLLTTVVLIGTLVGLEIPLLMRLLQGQLAFKEVVSRVLTFDYIGALAAALLFPLVLVPSLGLVRTSLVMGLCNAGVALWGTWLLAPQLGRRGVGLRVRAVVVLALLVVALAKAGWLTSAAEERMYADPIIYARDTRYQRIVVTRNRAGFNLFLSGNLQFASADEYRYHEALVHPAMMASAAPPTRVLILGGGDGLALREVLRYETVQAVTLVDLDPAMTEFGRGFAPVVAQNGGAFADPRVTVVNDDAMVWLDGQRGVWDVAIVDFPDPNNFALGKLYTQLFYRRLRAHLAPTGAIAVQATSPLFARKSYWCVLETIRAAGFSAHPYHLAVPSFGVWGYALATPRDAEPPTRAPALPLRYLNDDAMAAMFRVPRDLAPVPVEVNRLDNQVLVRYYDEEWRRWQ
jgi:spermidine synthase